MNGLPLPLTMVSETYGPFAVMSLPREVRVKATLVVRSPDTKTRFRPVFSIGGFFGFIGSD